MNTARNAGSSEKGFALIACAVSAVAVLGAAGLALDIGRMYIAKNELQTFADSAALAAVMELDGTRDGLIRAEAKVAASSNRWNLSSQAVTNPLVVYATALAPTDWEASPGLPTGYTRVRVTVQGNLNLFLSGAVGHPAALIRAAAIAQQQPAPGFRHGLGPFAPYVVPGTTGPHFGFTPGTATTHGDIRTIRWPANANKPPCEADQNATMTDLHDQSPNDFRGYIVRNSSDQRAAIVEDQQAQYYDVSTQIPLDGGAHSTQFNSIIERVQQDSDRTSLWYSDYLRNGNGNGRRIMALVMHSGAPTFMVQQIGAFFLRPESYYSNGGGINPICAEYIGAFVQGATNQGAGGGGAFIARLAQ